METRRELRAFSVSQSLICSRPEEIKRVGFSLQNLRVLSHTIDSIANSLFVVNQREKERENYFEKKTLKIFNKIQTTSLRNLYLSSFYPLTLWCCVSLSESEES